MGLSNRTLVLGITGGIACGKSEVGRILESLGFEVVDADFVAHRLMEPGGAAYERVLETFGSGMLDGNGGISRPTLARIVFSDRGRLEALNRLVHPLVRDELAQWMAGCRATGRSGAALVPLLFESGMEDLDWDAVWTVSSSADRVMERLAGRGLSAEEAQRRIRAQWPLTEKERRADAVIENNGSLAALEACVKKILEQTKVQ